MTTRRRFLFYVATALAAVGVFAGDVAQAGKPPALKLTVTVSPSTIIEGSTATGKVTHNNSSLTSPVTVTLSSSDTNEATVAATVTIPAGTNTVNFAVTAINDYIADGSQPVTITTAATGYASGSTNVTVDDAPTFQYVLTIPDLPADSTGGVYVNDMNNRGQVVGWYIVGEGRKGYLYDPSTASGIIDLNLLNLPGIPAGYQISSVVGINDHQVLVGYLTNDFGGWENRIGFAIDWAADTPVVDLLPDMGSTFSYGRKINENGDILGVFEDAGGAIRAYIHNPGVYGDPGLRATRGGSALNLSVDVPDEVLPLFVTGSLATLNNPVADSAAQVAGINNVDGLAFRYTTGLNSQYEVFPDIDPVHVKGINDSGMLCGTAARTTLVRNKTTTTQVAFRYNSSPQYLATRSSGAQDINNAGDVLGYDSSSDDSFVYRDNWGWRQVTNLPVIGQDDDMLLWVTSTGGAEKISNRVTADDVGYIAGGISNGLFLLTPVPVP